MKRIVVPMKRINTRITPEQHKFIKTEAKSLKKTEGEMFRLIISYFISAKERNLGK